MRAVIKIFCNSEIRSFNSVSNKLSSSKFQKKYNSILEELGRIDFRIRKLENEKQVKLKDLINSYEVKIDKLADKRNLLSSELDNLQVKYRDLFC